MHLAKLWSALVRLALTLPPEAGSQDRTATDQLAYDIFKLWPRQHRYERRRRHFGGQLHPSEERTLYSRSRFDHRADRR